MRLFDRVVSQASAMCGGAIHCELWHLCRDVSLSLFYKIRYNDRHPVGYQYLFSAVLCDPIRVTHQGLAAHAFTLEVVRVRTSQFSKSFVPACVRGWNLIDGSIFESGDDGEFKSLINSFLLRCCSLLFFFCFYFLGVGSHGGFLAL